MISKRKKTFAYGGLAGAILAAIPIYVQAAATDEASVNQLRQELAQQSKRLAAQERALKEQEKQLLAYKQMLEKTLKEQQQRIDEMQAQQSGTAAPQATQRAATKPPVAAKAAPPRVARTEQAAPAVVGRAPEKPKESRPPPVAPITPALSLLTPQGKFIVEPSVQYTFSSSFGVSVVGVTIPGIVIGLLDIASVDRSAIITSVTARYGVTKRLELEANLPYVSREDTTITRPLNVETGSSEEAFTATGNGIGDVRFAARYQLNSGAGDTPYYIGTLMFKTQTGNDPYEVDYDTRFNLPKDLPTGSGYYSLQPGLTVIYPSDPAVFFGGVSYTWNIERDIDSAVGAINPVIIKTVDPGDALTLNFGMGVSMNERASFSMGYQHSFLGEDDVTTENTAFTDLRAKDYQLGSLLLGYSYNGKYALNLTLGIGVTQDAPDTQLTLRVPFTF